MSEERKVVEETGAGEKRVRLSLVVVVVRVGRERRCGRRERWEGLKGCGRGENETQSCGDVWPQE